MLKKINNFFLTLPTTAFPTIETSFRRAKNLFYRKNAYFCRIMLSGISG